MKLLILLQHRFHLWNAPTWFVEKLRREFPQVQVVSLTQHSASAPHLPDSEVIVSWSLNPEQVKAAKALRWVHSPAAAVHQMMFPELVNSDVIVTNARDVHGPVVAEHVIALIFALAKRLPQIARFQQDHIWAQEILWEASPHQREVAGATLGLVGIGGIGGQVAKHASALGMRVIATREQPEKGAPEGVQQVFASSQIDDLLKQSDYVVLAVPLTPETQGLMNAARFAKMKPDACIINVGRGPLIDEVALIEVLKNKKIGGAALDVFDKEPLPKDSPLWDLENLFITPHTAGLTDKVWERHYVLLSENLRRYLAGEPLLAVVNKQKGY